MNSEMDYSCPDHWDNSTNECVQLNLPDCILEYQNVSNLKADSEAYLISFQVKLFWIFAFITMIMTSILGNLIIIWIILGHRKMRTATNIFILNLSFADLLSSLFNTSVNFIFMITGNWYFGYFFCKINNFTAYITLSASIFSIMALSIER